MSTVEKLKRLERISSYRWGIVPFWFRLLKPRSIFKGWACVREDKIEDYVKGKPYLWEKNVFPRNTENVIFEDQLIEEAINFALRTLDPGGGSPRKKPHYLDSSVVLNINNEILYSIKVDNEKRMLRVYAEVEDHDTIIIWKDWQDDMKEVDIGGFKRFLMTASVQELEKKMGTLKPCPD